MKYDILGIIGSFLCVIACITYLWDGNKTYGIILATASFLLCCTFTLFFTKKLVEKFG